MARIITAGMNPMAGYQGNASQITKRQDALSPAEAVALARLGADAAGPLVEGGSRLWEGMMGPPQMAPKPQAPALAQPSTQSTVSPQLAARELAFGVQAQPSPIGRNTAGEAINVAPFDERSLREQALWSENPLDRGNPHSRLYDPQEQALLDMGQGKAYDALAEEGFAASMRPSPRVNRSIAPAPQTMTPGFPAQISTWGEDRNLPPSVNPPGSEEDFYTKMARMRQPAPAAAPSMAPAAPGAGSYPALRGGPRTGTYVPQQAGQALNMPAPAAAPSSAPAQVQPHAGPKRVFQLDPDRVYHYERELLPIARDIAQRGTAEDRLALRQALQQSMGYGVHPESLGGLVRGNKLALAGEELEKTMGKAGSGIKEELELLILGGKLQAQPLEREKLTAEIANKEAQAKTNAAKADVAHLREVARLEIDLNRGTITREQAAQEAARLRSIIDKNIQDSGLSAEKAAEIGLLADARLNELVAKTGLEKAQTHRVASEEARNYASAAKDYTWISESTARQWALTHKAVGGGGGGAGEMIKDVNKDLDEYRGDVKKAEALSVVLAGAAKRNGMRQEDLLNNLRKDGGDKLRFKLNAEEQKAAGEAVRQEEVREAKAKWFEDKWGMHPDKVRNRMEIKSIREAGGGTPTMYEMPDDYVPPSARK